VACTTRLTGTGQPRSTPYDADFCVLVQPQPESAAQIVFAELQRYANTPVAPSMEAWAAERPMTLTAMEADEEWCTDVAERLADTIEAQHGEL
jgi:hypothetical protein